MPNTTAMQKTQPASHSSLRYLYLNTPLTNLAPNILTIIPTGTNLLLPLARYMRFLLLLLLLLMDRTAKTLAVVSTGTSHRIASAAISEREGIVDKEEV